MPLVLADRVRETTTTTGTGTISLAGPVSGFQGFSTAIGNANTTYYTIVDAATGAWEVGLGTYTASGSTLARTTVLSSSNSDALVPFGAGTKDVFVTQPAERAVYVLGAGTGLAAGAAAFTANGVPYASATNTLTTGSALTFDGTNLGVGGGGDPFGRFYGRSVGLSSASSAFLEINAATGSSSGIDFGVNTARTAGITSNTTETNFTTLGATPLLFGINGSEQMRLTSTGLGIGNSSPTAKLDVTGTAAISGAVTLSAGTANGVAYLNGSKVLTTGSALTFDGTNLGVGVASPGQLIDGGAANPRLRFTATSTGYATSQFANSSGASYFGRDNSAGSFFGIANGTVVYSSTNDPIGFFLGTNEQMRLTSTGLGIGTSSPSNPLHINAAAGASIARWSDSTNGVLGFIGSASGLISGAPANQLAIRAENGLRLSGQGNNTSAIIDSSGNLGIGTSSPSSFSGYTTVSVNNATNGGIYNILVNGTETARLQAFSGIFNVAAKGAATNLTFETNGAERMRLDSSGNLGIGTSSPAYKLHALAASGYTAAFRASTAATTGILVGNTAADTSIQTLSSGDSLIGSDSGKYLAFGTNGFVERMRLDSSGNLGIGTSSPGSKLHIDGNFIRIEQSGANTAYFGNAADLITGAPAGAAIRFNNTALRIASSDTQIAMFDSSGNLLVGTQSLGGSGGVSIYGGSVPGITINKSASGGPFNAIAFQHAGTTVGSITTTDTATAYNTSSDYRLKDNIAPMTGALAKVAALKPVTYKWKVDGSDGEGFIAHELAEVCPSAVVGAKDAVDAEGKPVYQGIDTSFLVATLTAAIQELKADLDATKAELAALKGA